MAANKYKWDGDSRDERESEFALSGYSTTTAGAFHTSWAQERVQSKRRARLAGLLWPLLIAAGLSVLVLYAVVTFLRG